MCIIQFEYFVCAFLILYVTHINVIYSTTTGDSSSLNSSEAIKNIFSSTNVFYQTNESVLKSLGNFAEGGLVSTNSMTTDLSLTTKNTLVNGHAKTKNNFSVFNDVLGKRYKNYFSLTHSTTKASVPTKLSDMGNNLFLGAPEVHINGTSSIKPRKGVYFNKIVPRKGVFNDNETNYSLSLNNTCFWVSKEECYSALDLTDIDCKCCKEGNYIGRIIKQQPIINCNSCKLVNTIPAGKKSCQDICCSNKLLNKVSYSVSTTEDFLNEDLYKTTYVNKSKNIFQVKEEANSVFRKLITEKNNNVFKNLTKKLKLKPNITKVPYDVEVLSELINKSSREIFVPVIVSIFLLPLIGILVFFLWKKTKEFWENRYYKRMDFLIDGMYND